MTFITMKIDRIVTSNMPDGQPLPPYMDNGAIWRVVHPLPSHKTLWRRISIQPITPPSPAATWPRDPSLGGK
jgi:hypothetical protein